MPRQLLLVFFLLLVAFTSQFQWRQRIVNEVEASPRILKAGKRISGREESVKEKIILSQKKSIEKLNELVRILQEQLLQCKEKTEAVNSIASLTDLLNELEQQEILDG